MLYTILVVEDDADINNLLAKMLRQADYQVTQVYSGSKAALRLEHESPDLILLDVMLPGMSGEALLEKLRGELSCDAPVIILSAKTLGCSSSVPTTISPSPSNQRRCWRASKLRCAASAKKPRTTNRSPIAPSPFRPAYAKRRSPVRNWR